MIPYILPFVAVMGGFGLAIFLRPVKKKVLKLMLAFSGSFLLAMTVTHLLPELYHGHSGHGTSGIFIMAGILLQIILEFFSKGAEHGHVHGHGEMRGIPWMLFISLCLHALIEGFPVHQHDGLALGIAIHHFPIAIILTLFFMNSHLSIAKILFFMMVFAVMTPLGTWLSYSVPALAQYHAQLTAVVVGILFHISSTIIFESSEGHKFNIAKVSMIVLGILLAVLI
jgi:zinc transporter ZupT